MSKFFKCFLALVFCFSALASADAADKLALSCKYTNDRYGYSVKYPDIFDKKSESDSGDGITLSSKDGKYKLLIWGGYNVLDETPDAMLAGFVNSSREGGEKTVSKQSGKSSCYLISHNEKKKSLSYRMALLDDGMYSVFFITYPKAEEKEFEKVIKEMKASLKL